MSRVPPSTVDLGELLHDATLLRAEHSSDVTFWFRSLRARDAEPIKTPVRVELRGVSAIVVGYDPAFVKEPLSRFVLQDRERLRSLQDLVGSAPLEMRTDSAAAREDVALCAVVDRWLGDTSVRTPRSFAIERTRGRSRVCVWIAFTEAYAFDGDAPLSWNDWADQYDAWWTAWREQWSKRQNATMDHEPDDFDAVIPAGKAAEIAEPSERPDEPAFAIVEGELPVELEPPLRELFEGKLLGDTRRMARAWPSLDQAEEDRARIFGDQRPFYARAVDDAWIEGQRALVTLRGIEHSPAIEDMPAENREAVYWIELRRRGDAWFVYQQSAGWPSFGSAPVRVVGSWRDRFRARFTLSD